VQKLTVSCRIAPFAMLAALLSSGTLSAQDGADRRLPVALGGRVRVQSSEVQGRLTGVVTALDDRSLSLLLDGGPPLSLRLDSLTSIESSLGSKRNAAKYAAFGALLGAALGLTVAVDANDCGPDNTKFCSRGEAVGAMTLGMAAIGALVGSAVRTERFAPIALAPVAPIRSGDRALGVAVAVSF